MILRPTARKIGPPYAVVRATHRFELMRDKLLGHASCGQLTVSSLLSRAAPQELPIDLSLQAYTRLLRPRIFGNPTVDRVVRNWHYIERTRHTFMRASIQWKVHRLYAFAVSNGLSLGSLCGTCVASFPCSGPKHSRIQWNNPKRARTDARMKST